MKSLRSRFLIGTVLWTAGLLAIAHLLSILLMIQFPFVMRMPHHLLVPIAVVFMLIGLAIVRGGLTLLRQLRDRLAAVRDGRAQRIEGTYPTEVEPLVDDLNALLAHREEVVRRAIAKAGDLPAHGLKTPLAVLAQENDPVIREQVERMRRQIEYHLAHARAAASGATPGTRSSVRESAEALARTMLRLHAERGLSIDVDVAEHTVRVEREDLDEMLGNLVDNACKWAKSRVVITSVDGNILVDDDGPGLAPEMREKVLQRGVRADEAAPGTGLGLAIVRDLAALYGGNVTLEASPAGGVRARLALPR